MRFSTAGPPPAGNRSERRAAAEAEELRLVVGLLGDRLGEVEADRTERRAPDQAHAGRRADAAGIGQADVDWVCSRSFRPSCCSWTEMVHTIIGRIKASEIDPSFIAPQRAGIGEDCGLDAELFRHERERE